MFCSIFVPSYRSFNFFIEESDKTLRPIRLPPLVPVMTVKRQSNKKKVAPEKFELDLRSDPEVPQIQNDLQMLTEDSKSMNAEVSEIRLGGIFVEKQLLDFLLE